MFMQPNTVARLP